jgi:hypothetical protein
MKKNFNSIDSDSSNFVFCFLFQRFIAFFKKMLFRRLSTRCFTRRRFSQQSESTSTSSESSASNTPPPPPPPSFMKKYRFRIFLAAMSPFAGWYYLDWQAQKAANADMQESYVSAGIFELTEIIKRSDITATKMAEVHANAENAFSNANWISCDDFGVFLKKDSESVALDAWDIHPLMRNAPTKRKGMGRNIQTLVDLSECLVASSLVLSQSEAAKERAQLAWKVVDTDGDGVLNFLDFTQLLEKMIRTGHFLGKTLLRRTEYFPPNYEILSSLGLGQEIFKALGIEAPTEETPKGDWLKYKITWDQFAELMESNKMKKKGQVWYYDPEMFKLRKQETKAEKSNEDSSKNIAESESTESQK